MEELQNYVVSQSNEFLRKAIIPLSAQQLKIILLYISKIEPQDTWDRDRMYTISLTDIVNCLDIEMNGTNTADIKRVFDEIKAKPFWSPPTEEQKAKGIKEVQCTIFRDVYRIETETHGQAFGVTFPEEIKDHLFELQKNFTSYSLTDITGMTSRYAIRLYGLLRSHLFRSNNNGQVLLKIDDLRKILGAEKKSYDNFHLLKLKVLDIAIEQINHTNINVTYSTNKQGKKVNSVLFEISWKY